jgi:hypothetical protein
MRTWLHLPKTESAAQQKLSKTCPSPAYDVGNLVKVTNCMKHKLDAKWRGPYAVVRRVSTTSYKIRINERERIHHIVHHAHLGPWYTPDDDDFTADTKDDASDDQDLDEEIEDVSDTPAEDPRPEDQRPILDTEDPRHEDTRPKDPLLISDTTNLHPEDPCHEDPCLLTDAEDPRREDAPPAMNPSSVYPQPTRPTRQQLKTGRTHHSPELHPIEEEDPTSDDGDEAPNGR